MKTVIKLSIIVAVIFIITGIAGIYFSKDQNRFDKGEKLDIETLEKRVDEYIESYAVNLEINDIFIFEDSDPYFSIVEEETGIGAMELLVDRYTGLVYPEFGPNMMWNIKYGMHNDSGYGIMRRGGMMGRNYFNKDILSNTQYSKRNEILIDDALNIAKTHIEKRSSNTQTVAPDGHEFYGYYTFHIKKDDAAIGMLSVNGYTGEVWYHDWHGVLIKIFDTHDDIEDHS